MYLWILFFICVIIEIICVPNYLKALWPDKCFKSLVLKMICSSGFVAIGVLSLFIAGNTSNYAITMIIGLCFGWVGDYFLHAKPTKTYFAIGFISFLLGHIVYIVAYSNALSVVAPDYVEFNATEIFMIIFLLGSAFFMIKMLKIKFGATVMKIGAVVYSVIITYMFVRASSLGFCYYLTATENNILGFLVLTAGSFLFIVSDATLAIIKFGGHKKNYPLKVFNIVTYFSGQVLLASSILFVNA